MNSGNGGNDSDSSNGRVLKIRVAAATVLKELGQLRSAGSARREALDVVQHRRDSLARLLFKIRRGEAGYNPAKKFLDENKEVPPKTEV